MIKKIEPGIVYLKLPLYLCFQWKANYSTDQDHFPDALEISYRHFTKVNAAAES